VISAPWSAFLYRLVDPQTREEAYQRVLSTWESNHFPFMATSRTMLVLDMISILLVILFMYLLFVLFIGLLGL